jgi:hypothetical protein
MKTKYQKPILEVFKVKIHNLLGGSPGDGTIPVSPNPGSPSQGLSRHHGSWDDEWEDDDE